MSQTCSNLQVRQFLVGIEALLRIDGRRKQVCTEHQAIIDALAAHGGRETVFP